MAVDRALADGSGESDEPRRRESFLALREILERCLDSLREIRRRLEQAPIRNRRDRLFADALLAQRRELESAIDQAIADAPGEVLERFVQYGVDPTIDLEDPPAPASASELTRWQTERDEAVSAGLVELAERLGPPDATELIDAVLRLIAAHDRLATLDLQQLRDL